jgi:hypothetical protein
MRYRGISEKDWRVFETENPKVNNISNKSEDKIVILQGMTKSLSW